MSPVKVHTADDEVLQEVETSGDVEGRAVVGLGGQRTEAAASAKRVCATRRDIHRGEDLEKSEPLKFRFPRWIPSQESGTPPVFLPKGVSAQSV